MKKRLGLAASLAALAAVVLTAAAAGAGGGNSVRASLDATAQFGSMDPAALAACPAGYDWFVVIETVGTGTMTSDVYTGPVTWFEHHCTRLLLEQRAGTTDAHTVGRNVGEQTVVTEDGDELYGSFSGHFVLDGFFPSGEYEMHGGVAYTITGGTGIFEGATGHGHVAASDPGGFPPGSNFHLDMNGSLRVSG